MGEIAENLARIREQIAAACRAAGRPESDVQLMAVSKTQPPSAVREAYDAGQRLFGENRVQEWQQKHAQLEDLLAPKTGSASGPTAGETDGRAAVHLIGPLQANKTTRAAELFHAVDSVDSLRIATRLDVAARASGRRLSILIEVKLSHEESKHGVAPAELPGLLEALKPLDTLVPSGLMMVPPWSEDPEAARPYFRELRRVRDVALPGCPTLTQLSMGMSNDFGVAIQEGSTCVRVGTALFGRREYPNHS